MSQENVELVGRLLPRPGQDLLRLVRDDEVWAAFTVAVTPIFHPDFECVVGGMPDAEKMYIGLDGFRAAWRDWTAPWATYRSEVDESVDLGDRVLVLFHDFARLKGTTEELNQTPANIWTVRDGKIARWEFYPEWRDALPALGWDGQAMSQENVEVVRRLYAKWEEALQDPDQEVYNLLDPEIEWDASRRTFDPGVFHGHDGVKEFVTRLREVWESGRIEPLEFISEGNEVVAPVRLVLVSRTEHQPVTANAAHVWTLRDGRVIRHRVFQTKAEALEAAGLSE